LPDEEIPSCKECKEKMMMIVQIFVAELPDFIRSLFREDSQDSLLVLGVCPQCLGSYGYDIRLYKQEELDRLEYIPDVGEKWSSPEMFCSRVAFRRPNSPQSFDAIDRQRQWMAFCQVSSWVVSKMVPSPRIPQVKKLLKNDEMKPSQRLVIASHDINLEHNVIGKCHLGGWPRTCNGFDNFVLLLSLCESEATSLDWGNCGWAELWIGVGSHLGDFKFTWSDE
jgi:hypothetical protein